MPPFEFCLRANPADTKPNMLLSIIFYAPAISMTILHFYLDHCSATTFQISLFQPSHIVIHPHPISEHTPLRLSNIYAVVVTIIISIVPLVSKSVLLDTHLNAHVESLSIVGVGLLILLVKGPWVTIWADRVEQENMRKEQENLQLMDIEIHQKAHEPTQLRSFQKQLSANQSALARRLTQADINAVINSWKWKWLVRFSNPKKYCWHNQSVVAVCHLLHSIDYILPQPESPKEDWTSYVQYFAHLYNIRDKFVIYKPVHMVSLLAEEFFINADMTPAEKEETRNKINNDSQPGELLLEALAKCDILKDFMPVTQTRIVTEPCKGCGQSVSSVDGNQLRNPFFQLQCPDETSSDEEKHLPFMFSKMMATSMGGDDCPYPGCESPENTKCIQKQLFIKAYQGFVICVNRIRTMLNGTRVRYNTTTYFYLQYFL